MLKEPKLSYIVPGYRGHIPSNYNKNNTNIEIPQEDPHGQIPGYGGHIKYVKPENIYGQTYGTITYKINSDKINLEEQELPENIYKSTYNNIHKNQNTVEKRKASELVGVAVKNNLQSLNPNELQNLTETVKILDNEQLTQKLDSINNLVKEDNNDNCIPGYTGHIRRVNADNIYGVTFGNSKQVSKIKQEELEKYNENNYEVQNNKIPKIK